MLLDKKPGVSDGLQLKTRERERKNCGVFVGLGIRFGFLVGAAVVT